MLEEARRFFAAREVLEVETPVLVRHGVTDLNLESLRLAEEEGDPRYLHTSPEYAMKRLLAAGSGDIYQICRVFRRAETGSRHNPEFTLIEWYRTAMDHHALMAEVAELAACLLDEACGWTRRSYREAWAAHVGLDPHRADLGALRRQATGLGLDGATAAALERDGALDFIFATAVQPRLGRHGLEFVDGFPASQAALARLEIDGDDPVASRFELFYGGMELANGYHELTDAAEQRRRMSAERRKRRRLGLPDQAPDERLLAALDAGLPECAGVAVGFDRLVMLRSGAGSIRDVLAFPYELA